MAAKDVSSYSAKELNTMQSDLSTAKRVHYSNVASSEGPPKGMRSLPMTPVPSTGDSPTSSPRGSPSHWHGGVEGETVYYRTSPRDSTEARGVHHSVMGVIEAKVQCETSYIAIRDAVTETLQRALTSDEIEAIQEALKKSSRKDDGTLAESMEVAEAERRKARQQELQDAQGGPDDDHEDLGHDRKVGVPETAWDPEAKVCALCKKEFGVFTRRHHCRGCGRNCCDSCSSHKAPIPEYYGSTPQRICGECHATLQFQKMRKG